MKTLGISIDGVVRDFMSQFDKHYRKVFINNPNLVEMNNDMTVKERTEEDWEIIDEIIRKKEKELISLPVNSYDLTNHYVFNETVDIDGVTKLTPEEAVNQFMYDLYPFQIFGHAEEYQNACDAVNRIQSYGLRNNLYKTVLISKTKSTAIPATFHFLSKNASRIRNVHFVEEELDKWNYCDIIIDCVPEVIQNVPKNKKIIKIEQPFNKWDETDYSFKSIKDINTNFIGELFDNKNE